MKLGYLMNSYPMTSTTFVRREIEAHERAGASITRFAVRPWGHDLVDPLDIAESAKVIYLLTGGVSRLIKALLVEVVRNPLGVIRAAATMVALMNDARTARFKAVAYLLEAILLKQQAAQRDIKHIHVHFSTNSTSVALLAKKLGGPKFSFTVHGPDELFEMGDNSIVKKIKNAEFVVAITNYCESVIQVYSNFEFKDKIHVVRCGIDISAFDALSPVSDNRNLVCVGRLCRQKAQLLLVEAIAQLRDTYPDLHLQLIGDGEIRPLIEQRIADLGLEDMIELVGWKDNVEVCRAIHASRALVLPSLAEGLPIVIMESFALRRPVVSTWIAGIPELVDDRCGWLALPGSLESLVAALRALLDASPDDLVAMGAEGRARVETQHDQDTNARTLRTLIE